nr:ribosomal protein L7/L12 [Oceanobacillus sojae]
MLQSGDGPIKATKYVREQTGLGLKEAKDFVDHVREEANM